MTSFADCVVTVGFLSNACPPVNWNCWEFVGHGVWGDGDGGVIGIASDFLDESHPIKLS